MFDLSYNVFNLSYIAVEERAAKNAAKAAKAAKK